jgi:PAS domain S-box-containing protein
MRFAHLKKNAQVRPSKTPSRTGILLVLSGLVLSAGIWTARESGQQTDLRMRRELARQARSIAETIFPHDVRALSFTAEDIDRPEFQRLSEQLRAYATATGLRSLYTMTLRDGELIFGPESLKLDDQYASPPGTVFQKPTEKDFEIFRTGEAAVQGPDSDEYGTFVTASAPVIDPLNGKVLITVGLDIETPVWKREIRKAQWFPFLIAMAPLGILLAGYLVLRVRQRLAHTHHKHLRHTEAAICAIIMLLLTVTAAMLFNDSEKKSRLDAFRNIAQTRAANYKNLFKGIHDDLNLLVRFFESSDNITRSGFGSYCKPLIENTPIQTCLWLPKLSAGDAAAFTEKVHQEGLTNFSICQLNEQGAPVPAQGRILYPALYIEPLSGHEKILGYDLYSNPLPRAAIAEAVSTGQTTATEPVNLTEQPDARLGFFIFKPVAARQQTGVAGFFLNPETLFKNQLHYTAGETAYISVSLFQLQAGDPPRYMACSMKGCRHDDWQEQQTSMHITVPVFDFGKTYSLLIVAEPQWLAAHPLHNGQTALIIGFVLTILLTTLIAILANRPALLEKQVQQRTQELHESEERLELATAAADIGVWDRDIVSNQLIWNERMYQIYGISPEEFNGTYQTWQKCVHPDDLQAVSTFVTEAELGKKEFNTEFRIVRPDGEVRHIRAFGKVIHDDNGVPLRMTGINYDITNHKQAEQQVQSQLNELNRWHQVTLGREMRILELKKEINGLLKRMGEPPRYTETADSLQKDTSTPPRL